MTLKLRYRSGVGSLIAGLFIILILLAFIASLIIISQSQNRFSEVITSSIEARARQFETNLEITTVEILPGNILNISVSNLGSIEAFIKYIGVFNKNTREGSYYNATKLGSGVKGVLINRFSSETNISTLETLNQDLSSGSWIIQLITENGIVSAIEYPMPISRVGNITTWNSLSSPPRIIPIGSGATYGHIPVATYYNATSITNLTGYNIAGDVTSTYFLDGDKYTVFGEAIQYTSTLYLHNDTMNIAGNTYFRIKREKTLFNTTYFGNSMTDIADGQYTWYSLYYGGYKAQFIYPLQGKPLYKGIYQVTYNVDVFNWYLERIERDEIGFSINLFIIDDKGNIVTILGNNLAIANARRDINALRGYTDTLTASFTLTNTYFSRSNEYLVIEYQAGLNFEDDKLGFSIFNRVDVAIYPFNDLDYTDFMKIIVPDYISYISISSTFSPSTMYDYLEIVYNYTSPYTDMVSTNISVLNRVTNTYEIIYSEIIYSPKSDSKLTISLQHKADYYVGGYFTIKIDSIFYGDNITMYIDFLKTSTKSFRDHGIYVYYNGQSNVTFYNIDNDTWFSITNAPFNWPSNSSITYMNSTHLLIATNTTHLLSYDYITDTWTTLEDLTVLGIRSGAGASLFYLPRYPELIFYVVGGGNSEIWIYNYTNGSFAPSKIILPTGVDAYSVSTTDGWEIIYLTLGYHSDLFLKINVTAFLEGGPPSEVISYLSYLPSTYLVGMDRYGDYIYVVDRGGAVYRYSISSDTWVRMEPSLPFSLYTYGDRLFAYEGRLYFIRMDSTRDIVTIRISDLRIA